jgi:beta-lactamase class A
MNYLKKITAIFLLFLLVSVVTGIILLGLAWYDSHNPAAQEISKTSIESIPVLNDTPFPTIAIPNPISTSPLPQLLNIQNSIQTVISSYPQLTWGVSFIDLNSKNVTNINGNKVFTGASTTKVLIACLLLNQVEAGKYNLDKSLNGATLKQLLQKMINQSDNDAWTALMNFIGFQYQQPYAQSIGIYSYDVVNNRIDPNDMALLLEQLYAGKLLNPQDTSLLLSYMQHTNNDDLIPPAVPNGVKIYHKYGSFNNDLHDAAIIDNGKNPFILTIYSSTGSGTLSYTQRVGVFHKIVTAVENADNIITP